MTLSHAVSMGIGPLAALDENALKELAPHGTARTFPKGTPKEAVAALHDQVVRAISSPDVREKLLATGAEASTFTPEEFARFVQDDTRRWTELIKASGIKVEP